MAGALGDSYVCKARGTHNLINNYQTKGSTVFRSLKALGYMRATKDRGRGLLKTGVYEGY